MNRCQSIAQLLGKSPNAFRPFVGLSWSKMASAVVNSLTRYAGRTIEWPSRYAATENSTGIRTSLNL